MLRITTSIAMQQAIDAAIDDALRALLTSRMEQLDAIDDYELGELAHFFVVEQGDDADDIAPDPTIGFDGVHYGDPCFLPAWEAIERHGDWFELTFILSDDGFGHVILIPDRKGIDLRLLDLCRNNT